MFPPRSPRDEHLYELLGLPYYNNVGFYYDHIHYVEIINKSLVFEKLCVNLQLWKLCRCPLQNARIECLTLMRLT